MGESAENDAVWDRIRDAIPEAFWRVAIWPEGNSSWIGGSLDVADRKRIGLAVIKALTEAPVVKSPEEKRWDTAIDWALNHGAAYDLAPYVFAHTDDLITEKELREESVSIETLNRREQRREDLTICPGLSPAPAEPVTEPQGERGGQA